MSALANESAVKRHMNIAFMVAWGFCVVFYFAQYALRSAPGVMVPELGQAWVRDAVGVSALVGLYYYTYSIFSLVAGAALDKLGARAVIPLGIVLVGIGAILFGTGAVQAAQTGRLLQGAGSAVAFTGAVYLATHGFPARWLATAIGFTQCFGMLGGAAGQFVVGPLVHGPIQWQTFWTAAGISLFGIALLVWLVTPREAHARTLPTATRPRTESVFAPYRQVLSNPQSYLCGFTAGLLFLPTTIGDMIWGMPFLREGLSVGYSDAVNRSSMVPLGWVIGCPLLGYLSDRIGRRKPVLVGGAMVMLLAGAAILYLPAGFGGGNAPRYLFGLMLGIGSGAAMIPYTIIKEVNADNVKGSATGAINFLVFTFSALLTPLYGKLLKAVGGSAGLDLHAFRFGGAILMGGVVLALVLALSLRETGSHARH